MTVRFLVKESGLPDDPGVELEEFKVEITNDDSTVNEKVEMILLAKTNGGGLGGPLPF